MIGNLIAGDRRSIAKRIGQFVVMVAVAAQLAFATPPARAQASKDMPEEAMKRILEFAWEQTPPQYTSPNGQTIVVDKSKPEASLVPMDVAREVTKIARLSSNAKYCGFEEEQVAVFRTLMAREEAKKVWSDQQLLFIRTLHMTVDIVLNGQYVARIEENGVIRMQPLKTNRPPDRVCTDVEKKQIMSGIKAYLEAAPTKKN